MPASSSGATKLAGMELEQATPSSATELESLRERVRELTRRLAEAEALVAERAALRTQLRRVETELAKTVDLENQVRELSADREHLTALVEQLRGAVSGYRNSTSWRITAPLRRARRLFAR